MNLNLIGFYEGTAPDDRGRYLTDIHRWEDRDLEEVHDYIQWLFPLRKRSPVNPTAPVLDDGVVAAFKSRRELRQRLIDSLSTMLRFYGFELRGQDRPVIQLTDRFGARSANWLTPGNHNYLRITRILACLRELGLQGHAVAFFQALQEVCRRAAQDRSQAISEQTFSFWMSAAGVGKSCPPQKLDRCHAAGFSSL